MVFDGKVLKYPRENKYKLYIILNISEFVICRLQGPRVARQRSKRDVKMNSLIKRTWLTDKYLTAMKWT